LQEQIDKNQAARLTHKQPRLLNLSGHLLIRGLTPAQTKGLLTPNNAQNEINPLFQANSKVGVQSKKSKLIQHEARW